MSTPSPIQPGTTAKSASTDDKFAHAHGTYTSAVPALPTLSPTGLHADLADPISLVKVPRDRNVYVNLAGIISDNDDTIARDSGERAHDGHTARFARGLSLVLMECHTKLDGWLLTQEQLVRYEETHSLFSPDDWAPFKGQAGQSEKLVLEGMLSIAKERFPLANGLLSLMEFELAVNLLLKDEDKFKALMTHVTADPGLVEFFKEARASHIPIAVCSASQPTFVNMCLDHINVGHLIQHVVGNAKKKTGNEFKGEPVALACQGIDVEPGQAVMFGDSVSDLSATRAGVGIVVICLPKDREAAINQQTEAALIGAIDALNLNEHRHAAFISQVNSFQRQPRYYQELTGFGHPITVLLVEDFNQVKLGGRLTGSGSRASYELGH